MAKDKKGKKAEKAAKLKRNEKKKKESKSTVTKMAADAGKIAAGVVIEEIVAATLVAAAAALRDPKRARAMASAAGKELKALTGEAAKEGSALWRLALEIAGRSLDVVGKSKEQHDSSTTRKPTKPAVRQKRGA